MSDELTEILSAAADTSSPCARVLRFHEDLHVAVRPRDFYDALKVDPAVVVRVEQEDVVPIDCRFRNGAVEFATEQLDQKVVGRNQFLDDVSDADEISVIHHAESQFKDAQQVCTDGGMAQDLREQQIEDEFVQEHAVSVDEAESFAHLGLDDEYHPTGGYWFPTEKKWGSASGWVSTKYDIPHGELIQYPCDDQPPKIRGRDDLPDWVVDRRVDSDADPEIRTDGGTSTSDSHRFRNTVQRRVSWVEEDGAVFESQWFGDGDVAVETYDELAEDPSVKRVVMHKKQKVRQHDRDKPRTETDGPGGDEQ